MSKIFELPLWDGKIPEFKEGVETPDKMTVYLADVKGNAPCLVIFEGGGYIQRSYFEGKDYAEFFNTRGLHAVVVSYRVAPNRHPAPLMDAQRGIKLVRAHASEWGIDEKRIVTVGSSAGGHLAAACTVMPNMTFTDRVPDAVDGLDHKPNGAILCYPVIELGGEFGHKGSGENLLGERYDELQEEYSLVHRIDENTPPCFLWHTSNDNVVNVKNSLAFAAGLRDFGVPFAMRIYPKAPHGIGLIPENEEIRVWADDAAAWVKNHI